MKRIEYAVGCGFDKDGQPLDDASGRLDVCREILAGAFEGFTELNGWGHWAGVAEPVKLFVVCADVDKLKVDGVAQKLAVAMRQQCVAVSVSEVAFRLVGGAS